MTDLTKPMHIIGGLPGGSVSALAAGADAVWIGTKVGLYRCSAKDTHRCERLPNAPLGILSLACSPRYKIDPRIIAGTHTGIYVSDDGGASWRAAHVPITGAVVLALCCAPGDASDLILAGTLEDGIWASTDGGEHWQARNFGVLDSAVYAIAFSPQFAADGEVFAGTDSAIYHSYNSARAWKPLDFPEEFAPILSLACSPAYSQDHTRYAGSERDGLFRSADGGAHWDRLDGPAASINALTASAAFGILAATETGLWQSQDCGETWQCLLNQPDVISLAVTPDLVIAGTVDHGAWMIPRAAELRAIPLPPIRSVSGLTLSPAFDQNRTAVIYGLQEGLWRTTDGGASWASLRDVLPSLDVYALTPSTASPNRWMAATGDGLWLSLNAGDAWALHVDQPTRQVICSPNGQWWAASTDKGLLISHDQGQTWQGVPGPWDFGDEVTALAIADPGVLYVALIEGVDHRLGLWRHRPSLGSEKVFDAPLHGQPVVSLWMRDDHMGYVGFGHQVWAFHDSGRAPLPSQVCAPLTPEDNLLALVGRAGPNRAGPNGDELYACTSRQLYTASGDLRWRITQSFDEGPVVAIALAKHRLAALLLGGAFGML